MVSLQAVRGKEALSLVLLPFHCGQVRTLQVAHPTSYFFFAKLNAFREVQAAPEPLRTAGMVCSRI
jgi:hypothetical protein